MCDCGLPVLVRSKIAGERDLMARHQPVIWWHIDDDNQPAETPYCATCAQGASCDHCLDAEDRVWPCDEWRILAEGWKSFLVARGYQEEWAPARVTEP